MITKKVLLATDFSESANQLSDCIKNLQLAGLEEVILLHVVNTSGLFGLNHSSEEKLINKKNKVEKKLEKQEEDFKDLDLKIESLVTVGSVANKIVEVAELKDVDLILISSYAKGYIKEIFLGSTTFDVIRTSTTPIWVEKYKEVTEKKVELFSENRFNKVLVPTDLSKRVDNVLDKVKESNEFIDNVVILSVIEKNISKEQLKNIIIYRQRTLSKVKSDLEDLGINVKLIINHGVATRNILEVADEEEVSLIMLPTRGSGTIKGLVIGSTTNEVVRRAKKPVLVFPS